MRWSAEGVKYVPPQPGLETLPHKNFRIYRANMCVFGTFSTLKMANFRRQLTAALPRQ